MNRTQRFLELDLIRSFAIIGMVIFHFIYIYNYLKTGKIIDIHGLFFIFGKIIQFTFIGLVGISLALSKQKNIIDQKPIKNFYIKQLKRFFLIALMAIIVSITTYLYIPEYYIRFGILHFMATAILLLMPIADKKHLAFITGFASIFIGFFIKDITVSSQILYPFGFEVIGINTIDHFPIFPWIAIASFGILIGNHLYKDYQQKFHINLPQNNFIIKQFCIIGRHSLLIYMIHVPIILGILKTLVTRL